MRDLRQQGHDPLILERGSDDFKLWKSTRIKGWRVPDVLCVDDAKRVEVRAKSKFKLSGSHSTGRAERHWSYGLADDDYMAFPVCARSGVGITDWEVASIIQYVRVGDLKLAADRGHAKITAAKAASQGAEKQIEWPVRVASDPGTVTIADASKLQYTRTTDQRKISFRLAGAGGMRLTPQVQPGDTVASHQVVAAVVPITRAVPLGPRVGATHYVGELNSANERIRFAAAKALSGFKLESVDTALLRRLNDSGEHVFIRLEAAASLARHDAAAGWVFFEQTLKDPFAENRLECCIVLAEVKASRSEALLMATLAEEQEHADVRASAAWALGEHRTVRAFEALASAFTARPDGIRVEAARALAKLAREHRPDAVKWFCDVADAARPGLAFALRKGANATADDMKAALHGDVDARQWVAYIIGTGENVAEIEKLREMDCEVYFAATLLWKMLASGVYSLEEYG